jgi:hypothetical protein
VRTVTAIPSRRTHVRKIPSPSDGSPCKGEGSAARAESTAWAVCVRYAALTPRRPTARRRWRTTTSWRPGRGTCSPCKWGILLGAEVALGAGLGAARHCGPGQLPQAQRFLALGSRQHIGVYVAVRRLNRIRRIVALVRRVGAAAVWFPPPAATVDIKRCVAYTQRHVYLLRNTRTGATDDPSA